MSQATLNIKHRNKNRQKFHVQVRRMQMIGVIILLTLFCVIFVVILLVINWLKNAQYLPISKLVITGNRYYTNENDVCRLILTLVASRTLITQDINIICNKIKSLPWIRHVQVRRQWPDAIMIYLIEYTPVARWNDQCMIDSRGNAFIVPIDYMKKQNLPVLYGPKGSENEVLYMYHKMREMLKKHNFLLKRVAMTSRHSWQLTLMNNIKINLGRCDIIKRLARFIELYPILIEQELNNSKKIKYIDLRYNTGAAVGWFPCIGEKPKYNKLCTSIGETVNNDDQDDGQKTGSWVRSWHCKSSCFSR